MSKFIKVKVFPNSKKAEIIKKSEDVFEIFVREKPENNKANMAVFAVLADYFKIPISRLKLIEGRQQRNKIFEVIA